MDMDKLITLCEAWNDLGWAVQEQVKGVLDGDDPSTKSDTALEMGLTEFAEKVPDEIDGAKDLLDVLVAATEAGR